MLGAYAGCERRERRHYAIQKANIMACAGDARPCRNFSGSAIWPLNSLAR